MRIKFECVITDDFDWPLSPGCFSEIFWKKWNMKSQWIIIEYFSFHGYRPIMWIYDVQISNHTSVNDIDVLSIQSL